MSTTADRDNSGSSRLKYLGITALVLACDQLSKLWAAGALKDRDIEVIPGFFSLSYTENRGIAFGMLGDGDVRWLLVAVSSAATAIVVYYMMKTPSGNRLLLWSLALLAAGICGNLVDRVRMGSVIDFILFYYRTYHWPVFNIADTSITIGAVLMALDLFLSPQPEKATAVERNERPIEDEL
ncbi:MAG TPA: signal peptidase II [Blastocatellia bacterium]|jgi:signal peptidase II|nr:signal peptidase II [Blastocatellia bacterium]